MAYWGSDRIVDRLPLETVRQRSPAVLTVVAVGIALLVLSPLVWLFLRVGSVGAASFVDIATSPTTLAVTGNTVVLVTLVTACSILIGVTLAILTVQTDLPLRRFWTVTGALPLVVPSYIGAFAFVSALGPNGLLASELAPLGVDGLPSISGLPGTVLVLTLFTYPYVFLTTRAALLSFDGTAVEAARSLNHTRWEAFKRVTFPQIAPGVAAGALLVALYTLSDFGTPAIMTFDVFTRTIFNDINAYGQGREYATVRSLLLLAMAAVLLALESRIEADQEGAYVSRGSRRPGEIRLGRWKVPSLAFCSTLAVVCLAIPVGILLLWLGRASSAGTAVSTLPFDPSYAVNSVLLAGGAALVGVAFALPVAYLAARGRGPASWLPERATYVGFAVPGVVLGLALIYLGLQFSTILYHSVTILVFAYVVRFLPQAVGTTKSSILQVDPSYVEAARSLGDTPLSAFRRVVLPLVAPGVAAGAALVFLTTMKELPATLLLRPPGFETLVTHMWQVQEATEYGQAAVPALILIVVSALSMLVILGRERYNAPQ